MTEERVHECEDCGHAYTGRYGREVQVGLSWRWLCHECIEKRRKKNVRST